MPFPRVLGCDHRLVGVNAENSEVVQETPHPFFLLPLGGDRTPHEFSEHHAFRQSCVLHARHSPREQDPPLAQCRIDALAPRLHKGFEIGDWVVGASALSQCDAAVQEAVVGSAQRVVVTRARAPRDTTVQHCLEYFGFQHPDLELEGGIRPETTPRVAYAPIDLDGQVGVVVDVPPEVYEIVRLLSGSTGRLVMGWPAKNHPKAEGQPN